MTLLAQQIEEINEQVEPLISGIENRKAIEEYNTLLEKLTPVADSITKAVSNRLICIELPEDFASPFLGEEERILNDKANKAFNLFEEYWIEVDYKARQGNQLNDAIKKLSKFTESVLGESKRIWEEWIQSLESKFAISETLLADQINLPGNEEKYKSYHKDKSKFDEFAEYDLIDSKKIKALIQLADRLECTINEMKMDAPDCVLEFFKIINSTDRSKRFPLKNLTEEIIDWLKEKDVLDNYIVAKKGDSNQ